MITGEKRTKLSIDNILKRVTEYDIFKYYIRNDFIINELTFSPFRFEDHPSFMIGNRGGYLYFIDFGDTSKRGDCFDFVRELFNLPTMREVFLMIDRDFGLGIESQYNVGRYKAIKAAYKQPEEVLGKRYSVIQVVTRKFTPEELTYWNQFHQDIQDLRDNNIYSIDKLYLNRKRFSLKETELRFGYLYDGCWKIYRPYEEKRQKWVPNNVPITVIEGKENINGCDVAFINKSKKDYMVIRKLMPHSCAVQNEGAACFSEENVKFFKENSKHQILSFDSDVTGVRNSQQITQLFGFGYCNVPRKYLSEDIKDWADLAKAYGMKPIEDYLKEKGII